MPQFTCITKSPSRSCQSHSSHPMFTELVVLFQIHRVTHTCPFSCPKLEFIFSFSFLIFPLCEAVMDVEGAPASPHPVHSRRASSDRADEMKSTWLSGGVFPQCLFESLQSSVLKNQVKTCHESRCCFISTQLKATSCLEKTTVPRPEGQHMERQTSATNGLKSTVGLHSWRFGNWGSVKLSQCRFSTSQQCLKQGALDFRHRLIKSYKSKLLISWFCRNFDKRINTASV